MKQGAHKSVFLGRRGENPKTRLADCGRCQVWNSLVDAGVGAAMLRETCDRLWLNRVKKGQVLYLEGNEATHFYSVRAGRVKLFMLDLSGREHVIAVLESGDVFGLEAVFDNAYTTSAEAQTDSEVCRMASGELRALMNDIPLFTVSLARYLHGQLTLAREHLAFLGTPGARSKIAGYIMHRLSQNKSDDPVITHDLTLRELGGVLGLAPETICRTLSAFQAEGIVELQHKKIRVRCLSSLRKCTR